MAATVKSDNLTHEISAIDADYVWTSLFTSGLDKTAGPRIDWIMFMPGQANDKMIIKHGSDAGPIGFRATCLTAEEKIVYFHGARFPFVIDQSECVLNTGHQLIIQLWPRPN